MKKYDILADIVGRPFLPRSDAAAAVNTSFEATRDAVGTGETVVVTGSGAFSVSGWAAYEGHNPRQDANPNSRLEGIA